MLETKLYLNQTITTGRNSSSVDFEGQATRSALNNYRAALLRAAAAKMWTAVSGRKQSLLDLNEVEKQIQVSNRHHAGIQAVAMRKIVGSLGRCTDFDAGFNPLNENTRDRWLSVARARLLGIPLPPVELIQVGKSYFVRDGHHRISVARSFGEQAIDAEVTVWEVLPGGS
jgi:hypothetical protein